jgi:lysozyme family protein
MPKRRDAPSRSFGPVAHSLERPNDGRIGGRFFLQLQGEQIMPENTTAQDAINAAISVLVRRRANTADPAEKQAIDDAVTKLNGRLHDLRQASLLQVAAALAAASGDLEQVIGTARLGPFDTYLSDVQAAAQRLQAAQGEVHRIDNLPSAAAPESAAAAGDQAVAPMPTTPPMQDATGLPAAPINGKNFDQLANEYQVYFNACVPSPAHKDNIAYYVSQLMKFKDVYSSVGDELHIPWYFIGAIHGMECGFNFNEHLHNGDPLTARTVHVPANRPATGAPPFTWRESARDAMIFRKYAQVGNWDMPRVLYQLELYNGMGYRPRGVPSPYLWSFSNLYSKGKYTGDGNFDPNAVSKQCGAAVMLKALLSGAL